MWSAENRNNAQLVPEKLQSDYDTDVTPRPTKTIGSSKGTMQTGSSKEGSVPPRPTSPMWGGSPINGTAADTKDMESKNTMNNPRNVNEANNRPVSSGTPPLPNDASLNMVSEVERPYGVYIEKLQGFTLRDIERTTPTELENFLLEKGALDTYSSFVQEVMANVKQDGRFEKQVVQGLRDRYQTAFLQHGVNIFLCSLDQEFWISNNSWFNIEHKWIEYVDMQQAPDYRPVDEVWAEPEGGLGDGCVVM